MENMVENVAGIEAPQADTVEAAELTYSDYLAETGEKTAEETVVEEPLQAEGTPQADVAEKTYTQKDFDAVVSKRITAAQRDMQKRLEGDPLRALGKMFADMTGETDPIKAAEKVRAEAIQKQAEQLAQDPTVLAQMLLQMQMPAIPAQPDPDIQARRFATELLECQANGELPPDLDPNNLAAYEQKNPGFLADAATHGVRTALLKTLVKKPTDIAAAVAQARALPSQTKPAPRAPEKPVDIKNMSSAEFAKLDAWVARQLALKKRVKL